MIVLITRTYLAHFAEIQLTLSAMQTGPDYWLPLTVEAGVRMQRSLATLSLGLNVSTIAKNDAFVHLLNTG